MFVQVCTFALNQIWPGHTGWVQQCTVLQKFLESGVMILFTSMFNGGNVYRFRCDTVEVSCPFSGDQVNAFPPSVSS